MSDVLQRIAAVHRERVAKTEKTRLTAKRKLELQQAYFRDSGIPEMWEDVKNIQIKNPIPDRVEGITVPLSALIDEFAVENISKTGLVLLEKQSSAMFYVQDESSENEEQPKIYYIVSGKINFRHPHDHKDIKRIFCDAFVKWLAKYITAPMLLDMNIELEAPSVTKRSRKILQLAET